MSENIKPLSAVEGKAYINGIEVMDSVKMTIRFVPKVANYRIVGKKGTHRRWVGYDITGTLDEYKTTARYERIVREYISNGKTPEFTFQGIRTDPDSDYYETVGSESVTVTGAVITGEIPLLDIDTDGELVKESIAFGARNVV